MLGVGMLFVGATLVINGGAGLLGVDKKSLSSINWLTGILLFMINSAKMLSGDYYEAATGFMFAFTYLIYAATCSFKLDDRIYGLFCLFVALNTIPASLYSFFVEQDGLFTVIWLWWGVLWALGFIETVLTRKGHRPTYYLAIISGVLTTWIPGFLMITNQL